MPERERIPGLAEKYGITVLYEDNHLLVVEKPVNMPVQADISGDEDLCTRCRKYLKEEGNKPGDAFLGIVQRLDRPVGGVMTFAKTSKAAARLTAQFKTHSAGKRYVAIVCGRAESHASLKDYLLKDERTNMTSVVDEDVSGAKLAKLSYDTIGKDGDYSLVDVSLQTGRPHQIRVQMAHAGLPILGDQRYHPDAASSAASGKPFKRTQICLWSYSLTLEHPTLGEKMTFFSVPKGEEWKRFSAQMEMLPAFSVCSGVYVDDTMVVCDKKAGVEVEEELLSELSTLFPEIYPVHRLDANTQGLVVFARTEEKRQELEEAFYRHRIGKIYHAVLAGTPERKNGHLKDYAVKDSEEGTVRICGEKTPGAQRMELDYRILKEGSDCALAEIDLLTGRTHQIRVQMANIGCPVLGDDKYGNREQNKKYRCRTQQLLCKRLRIGDLLLESCKEVQLPEAAR